ncbi:hypothetical protein H2201_000494 [Coniosporium apollinis]|uniref:OPA3-like protein n=2 Tax=Coniosporium TaxID=2810619 RepID=A0ABQ9P8D2_9PEZI|nr:hypothetical protein H2199_001240 [Cladosporium sp. JES 115]KAJ9669143.1 hypothetical protein H2201_000494 [Coniosporium apollinis]
MSLTLKIASLAIRTLAKPIANYIKRNAREHERFRKVCVNFAQRLHRIDINMRLGLLQDTAAIDRQVAREKADADAKKKAAQIPTVKTEAQTKADEEAAKSGDTSADKKPKPRVRPLSEAKAIEMGANFISESFMFMVAGGIIIFESWRSRRKASNARENLDDRIDVLEAEREEMKATLKKLESELETLRAHAGEPPPSHRHKRASPKAQRSTGTTHTASSESNSSRSSQPPQPPQPPPPLR